ncbi:hypothetical protein RCL1_002363 [Eukaryota sp. TZLM3-RCL]
MLEIPTFHAVTLEQNFDLKFLDASGSPVSTEKSQFSKILPEIYWYSNLPDYVSPKPIFPPDVIAASIDPIIVESDPSINQVTFTHNNLSLFDPLVGVYELRFTTFGNLTYHSSILFSILPGAPDHLNATFSSIIDNGQDFSGRDLSVAVQDYLGNVIDNVNLTITVSAVNLDGHFIKLDYFTDTTVFGIARFSDLIVTTMPGSIIRLTFSSPGLTPSTLSPLPVRPCPQWMVGECPLGTCSCVCGTGAHFVSDITKRVFDSACSPCPHGQYKHYTGNSESCTDCPSGLTTRSEGSPRLEDCYCHGVSHLQVNFECKPCPDGLRCLDGMPNGTLPGFWSTSFSSPNAYVCPVTYCLARTDEYMTDDDVCSDGHTGPLCTICAKGFTFMGKYCQECNTNAFLEILVVLGFLVYVVGYVIMLIRGSKNPRSTQSLYQRILTNHTQILSSVGDFGVRWPGLLRGIFGIADSTSGVPKMKALGCTFKLDFLNQSILQYCFPPAMLAVLWVYYARKHKKKSHLYVNDPAKKRPMLSRTFGRAVLAVFYFLYTMVTRRALMSLYCIELDGVSYLANDLSIRCDSAAYTPYKIISWGALLFYGFGLPLYFFYMLFRDRNEGLKRLDGSVPPSRFLRSGYTNEHYYWEVLVMVRKLIITLLVVYLANNVALQLVIGIYLFVIWILLQVLCKPFHDTLAHTLELTSLSVLFVTLLGSLSFFESEEYATQVVGVLFALNVVCLVFLGHVLAKLFLLKAKRFFLNRSMKKSKISDSVTELATIKMIANPLHMKNFRTESDEDSEDETVLTIKKALQVAEHIPSRRQGPFVLYSEDLIRLKMVSDDVNVELLEDVSLEFSSTSVGIVDVVLSFANALVPPQHFELQVSELELNVRLKKRVVIDFLELEPQSVLKYVKLHFRWN